jgi:hypothetical protein
MDRDDEEWRVAQLAVQLAQRYPLPVFGSAELPPNMDVQKHFENVEIASRIGSLPGRLPPEQWRAVSALLDRTSGRFFGDLIRQARMILDFAAICRTDTVYAEQLFDTQKEYTVADIASQFRRHRWGALTAENTIRKFFKRAQDELPQLFLNGVQGLLKYVDPKSRTDAREAIVSERCVSRRDARKIAIDGEAVPCGGDGMLPEEFVRQASSFAIWVGKIAQELTSTEPGAADAFVRGAKEAHTNFAKYLGSHEAQLDSDLGVEALPPSSPKNSRSRRLGLIPAHTLLARLRMIGFDREKLKRRRSELHAGDTLPPPSRDLRVSSRPAWMIILGIRL